MKQVEPVTTFLRKIKPIHNLPRYFLKISFNIILPTTPLLIMRPDVCTNLSSLTFILHASPISFSSYRSS
jgi:hypothetical protein